ncbi:MAG: hypothetical protein EPO61_02060 [Nitrospirae bacterium]|nr:MAG: hypothetical protein EPO61_02060 [Nitrospirota bacterium]
MITPKLPDICSCDVEDKEQLALYRRCRERWLSWILGDDEHAIGKQITQIIWDDAIFRTLNEARRIAAESPGRHFNSDLLSLLDRGFVTAQVMALRRLTDPGFHDPKKEVVSLVRLLKDIDSNRDLLTREHYICYDGTPFCPSEGELDMRSDRERMNKRFDQLSGTSRECRSRKDCVKENIINKVIQSLKVCDDFRDYANKFVAHAAAPSPSRERIREESRITLDKFNQAHRAVIRAASFVGADILFESTLGRVPAPLYNHLEHLDKPLVLSSDSKRLKEFWHARVKEVDGWSEDRLSEYIDEPGSSLKEIDRGGLGSLPPLSTL